MIIDNNAKMVYTMFVYIRLGQDMNPNLPIHRQRLTTDRQGRICKIEVSIEQTADSNMYPPNGLKCVFKVLREKIKGDEEFEIVLLIDNHKPFGFHNHPKLPLVHDVRGVIHASSWDEAWHIFDKKVKELLDEA